MKSKSAVFKIFIVTVVSVALVGCGGSDNQGSTESVSMSESGDQQEQQQQRQQTRETSDRSSEDRFQNRRSSSRSRSQSSASPEEVMEQTGVYPTNIKTFQSGFAQLTLNGELTVYSIKLPQNGSSFPTWPKEPGDERGANDLIYFENFDLKKALNKALNEEMIPNDDPPSIEITDMRANAYESGSLRGFMDITFNEAFTVNGVKLMQSDGEYWVAWPQEEADDGNYYDLVSASKELNNKVAKMGQEKMDL